MALQCGKGLFEYASWSAVLARAHMLGSYTGGHDEKYGDMGSFTRLYCANTTLLLLAYTIAWYLFFNTLISPPSVCEYYAHIDCSDFSVPNCKNSATYQPGTTLETVLQRHHWREGNLPPSSKCAVSDSKCAVSDSKCVVCDSICAVRDSMCAVRDSMCAVRETTKVTLHVCGEWLHVCGEGLNVRRVSSNVRWVTLNVQWVIPWLRWVTPKCSVSSDEHRYVILLCITFKSALELATSLHLKSLMRYRYMVHVLFFLVSK